MYSDPSDYARRRKIATVSVIAGILALVGLITLFTSMRTVATGHVGVITQYGNVTGRQLPSGFAWVLPWGLNNVTEYDVKTQKENQTAPAATKDLQDVTAQIVITYHLDPTKVSEIHRTVGVGYKGTLIDPVALSAFKASSAKFNATELINKRAEVEDSVKVALVKKMSSRGITVEDVAITDMQFSKEFTQAIESRQVAQQNAERAQYNLDQARLDAQAQDVQAKTLTDNYLRLKELEVQQQAIKKWNGIMPSTVAGDGTIFNIPTKK